MKRIAAALGRLLCITIAAGTVVAAAPAENRDWVAFRMSPTNNAVIEGD